MDELNDNFYDILAECYDSWQKDNDSEQWSDYILSIVDKYGPREGDGENKSRILVDLGCGTGRVAVNLSKRGFDTIGIDLSSMMLNKAMDLAYEEEQHILWLNQDITEYELYGTADVFISLLDTVNHLEDIESLEKIFASFRNYMNPNGIFIFDIATEFHFKTVLSNNVFFEDAENYTLLWVNEYNSDLKTNCAGITLFEKDSEDKYQRFDGTVTEHFFAPKEIEAAAVRQGLKVLAVLGNLSMEVPKEQDERVFFVIGKDNK